MNRFYFSNKENPGKTCYEAYGTDFFTGIRYSIALCGTRKAAERALEVYLARLRAIYAEYSDCNHEYESLFGVIRTTVQEYANNRIDEMCRRISLRQSYLQELMFFNCHEEEITNNIFSCRNIVGAVDFQIGNGSELDVLERACAHCTSYRVTKRYADDAMSDVELLLELFFKDKDCAEGNEEIPVMKTIVQNQSAVIFRGSEDELRGFMSSAWFRDACMSFFHQAAKNHFYGFRRLHYLYNTPVYKDCKRSEYELEECFMGFMLRHGHATYKPGRKKVWYD